MEWWSDIWGWLQDSGVWSGVVANALWALVGATAILCMGAYRRDRRRFAGRWSVTIRWTSEWGEHLLGRPVTNPYSNGDISLAYGIGERRRQYYGLGYFQLFDGMTQYSHLCVRVYGVVLSRKLMSSRFPFLAVSTVRSWDLESLIREKLKRFTYPPFAQYRMQFTRCDGDRMQGEMIVVHADREDIAGSIEMERIV